MKYLNIYKEISKNIKNERKYLKLTQADLAELTGYSYEYIRRIESCNSKCDFSIQCIYIISVALEKHFYTFFLLDSDKKSNV